MKLFCMCQITGKVPEQAIDSQGFGPPDNQVYLAPNRFAPHTLNQDPESKSRPAILSQWMACLKTGVEQYIPNENKPIANKWPRSKKESDKDLAELTQKTSRHYPNLDMYRCRHCGAIVLVEGDQK